MSTIKTKNVVDEKVTPLHPIEQSPEAGAVASTKSFRQPRRPAQSAGLRGVHERRGNRGLCGPHPEGGDAPPGQSRSGLYVVGPVHCLDQGRRFFRVPAVPYCAWSIATSLQPARRGRRPRRLLPAAGQAGQIQATPKTTSGTGPHARRQPRPRRVGSRSRNRMLAVGATSPSSTKCSSRVGQPRRWRICSARRSRIVSSPA